MFCGSESSGGMWTVHRVIVSHGGEVGVESHLGLGTIFRVTLPLYAPLPVDDQEAVDMQPRKEELENHLPEGASQAPGSVSLEKRVEGRECSDDPSFDVDSAGELIVVAEDEEILRRLAVRILHRGGFRVLSAGDGQEGLDICRQLAEAQVMPDLILTDVLMPNVNGPEFGRRALQIWPQCKILYMSGYVGDSSNGSEFGLSGNEPLLRKPFSPARLLDRVRRHIDGGPSS